MTDVTSSAASDNTPHTSVTILSHRRPVASLARFSRLRDFGFDTQRSSALSNAGYDIADGVLFKPVAR